MMGIEIIKLSPGDDRINEALELARSVFIQVLAPSFEKEGTDNFINYTKSEQLRNKLNDGTAEVYIREENGTICSMMVLLDSKHITLAFTAAEQRHKGIGTALFGALLSDHPCREITVNSSPYGVRFYRHLGFVETDMETLSDGIRFTPMKYSPPEIF